jgi:ATP-dependent protease ClpP protease subunit
MTDGTWHSLRLKKSDIMLYIDSNTGRIRHGSAIYDDGMIIAIIFL